MSLLQRSYITKFIIIIENIPQFNIGEYVIYNSNIPDLEPPHKRLRDIAIVTGFNSDYVEIKYILTSFSSEITSKRLHHNDFSFQICTGQ